MSSNTKIVIDRKMIKQSPQKSVQLKAGRNQPPLAWKNKTTYLNNLLVDPWYSNIAQISSTLYSATHDFFASQKIAPFVFPVTTGSVSSPMGLGSDSMPVRINLRGNEVFLADSMQFSLEVGARLNSRGSYYVMPTFRGEMVDARHLNEFVHAEAEIPGELDNVIDLAERYVGYLVRAVLRECENAVRQTAGETLHLEKFQTNQSRPFLRIRYDEAIKDLSKTDGTLNDIHTGFPSITSKGEAELLERHGDFIWLINMPWANVPFYQAKEAGTDYSMTGDLLAGIGEILGCGQRVASTADLRESLSFHKVSASDYQWYADMREQRPMQTSGFGLGIERLILWITQTKDIRNCSLLYRDHDQVFFP